jgi:hypothetical protein
MSEYVFRNVSQIGEKEYQTVIDGQELKSTNIPNEDIECLRSLCRQYYKLSDELTAYKNRLTGIVDQLMLNFKDVFSNIFSKAAMAVLDIMIPEIKTDKTAKIS